MATLSLKHIDKIYPNKVQAVFDFNLDIKDKEFIVFVGPSGCGKSTTLRMIAGLEAISRGELYIDDELMNSVEPKDRNIAMVFQSYALYPHMSTYANMAFSLKLRKTPHIMYEPNEEVDKIEKEIDFTRKEIKKIDRVFKKKQNADELLAPRKELLDKINNLEERKSSILSPVMGKDVYGIKVNTKLISAISKDIEYYQKRVEKVNKAIAKDPNDQKFIDKANDFLAMCNEQITAKTNKIEEVKKKIEYLETNDVPLYKMRKDTKKEMDLVINNAAEILDLTRYLYRKPAALSGGQRQRVALGRAIVRKPKVFLMDEPLSNLDAKLRVQTRSEIAKLHKKVGATTIYVTHDQTEAMTMADRIVIMRDGYIQQIGTPEEVYDNPANKFVGGFIGSPAMNFIKGKVKKGEFIIPKTEEKGSKDIKVELAKSDVSLLKEYEGKDVLLGVRPESITYNKKAPKDGGINLQCEFTELLGYESVVYSNINGQRLICKADEKLKISDDSEINISLNNNKFYFFDAETEQRIAK